MSQTIYESFTEDYMPYTDDTYKRILNIILSHASTNDEIKVLELGCGSGPFTRFLAEQKNITITAVDASENLLTVARQKIKNAHFIQGYIDHTFLTGLPLQNYDLILSFCFLHHLSPETRMTIAACLLKYMKRGAIFACFEPNRDNPAILFQYLFETKLNKKSYDSAEFPLGGNEIDEMFPLKKVFKYYMDVIYRNTPPHAACNLVKDKIRKMFMRTGFTIKRLTKMDYTYNSDIRFGETGNAVYKKCSEYFGELYRDIKGEKDEKKKYDYFLSVIKNV